MAGLGIILTPYGYIPGAYPSEIARTTGGGQALGPFDPQYRTSGEAGFYYDTPLGQAQGLGVIPNDFELARQRGILTPNHGWIATQQGDYANYAWVPPNGWTPTGATGAKIALGDAGAGLDPSAAALVAELAAHHRRLFILTALSTAGSLVASIIIAVRTLRLAKQDRAHGG